MKRSFIVTAAALLAAVILFPIPVSAISAEKAIVIDANTQRVLYEKNADATALIASTTKIMTALVVCEQCNVLDRVKIPPEAVGIEGSSMYLKEGEILTVQELLYGLMLQSGNDAAVALAIYCGGTVEGFVSLMNDKAASLGLKNTKFENPNGLDGVQHYSTARDLAVLAAYAMSNPIFSQVVSTKSVRVGERTLTNHNKLLWRIDGAEGVKTGYTKAAGRTLVSSTVRDNRRLIVVTLNAPDDWNDHKQLTESGFQNFTVKQIIRKGDCVGTVEVAGGRTKTVELIAAEDFSYALQNGEQVEILPQPPGFVYAPVSRGQDAGVIYICIGENAIGTVPVVYGKTIERKK